MAMAIAAIKNAVGFNIERLSLPLDFAMGRPYSSNRLGKRTKCRDLVGERDFRRETLERSPVGD
jgi:hypothetical protein